MPALPRQIRGDKQSKPAAEAAKNSEALSLYAGRFLIEVAVLKETRFACR